MFKYEITRNRDDEHNKATVVTNLNNQILFVCPAAEHWFGFSQQELAGQDFKTLSASSFDCPQLHQFETLQHEPEAFTFRHKEGYFFTAYIRIQPCTESYNELIGLTQPDHPEHDYKHQVDDNTEQALKLGRWRYQPDTDELRWSAGAYAIIELEPESRLSSEHVLFFFQANQNRVQALIRRCQLSAEPFSLSLPILTASEQEKWVHLTGEWDAEEQAVSGTLQDISDLTEKSRHQDQAAEILTGVMEASVDLIMSVDENLNITSFNRACLEAVQSTFGFSIAIGDNMLETLHPFPNERLIYQKLWQRALSRDGFALEIPLAHRDEPLPIYEIRFSPTYNRKGQRMGAAMIARLQNQSESPRNKLNYLAQHDPLTGLHNRRAFSKRLQSMLESGRQGAHQHTLIYLDLDNFKQFNEKHGSSEGDQLLQQIAQLLRHKLRQRDTIARIGGDSFAALLENCDDKQATKVAKGLKEGITQLVNKRPAHIQGNESTQASIGLVPVSTDFTDAEALLKTAQETCYAAKSLGKNRINVFQASSVQRQENRAYIDALQRALEDYTSLQLAYQLIRPINSAVWGEHFEVLSRLHDQELGLVMPDLFLPVAEEFDIAGEFDRQVIRKVLHWLSNQRDQVHRKKLCTINLATTSLSDAKLADFIANELHLSQLEPGLLCFEMDEPAVIAKLDESLALMQRLNELGCKIALDNVGRAGRSPDYLKNLPVHFVKIDGRLIKQMQDDPIAQIMVESIHRIASLTGKQTIASGIENHAVLAGIRKMGIHFGQGFGIAQPRPLSEAAA